MATILSGTITLDGQPLKRTFFELFVSVSLPGITGHHRTFSIDILLTDDNGQFSAVFDTSVILKPFKFVPTQLTLKIYCHNSTIRVLKAATPDEEIHVLQNMTNGGTLNLTQQTLGEFYDHFRILEQCLDVYDTVWRQFQPYSLGNRGDFPLTRKLSLAATFLESDFVTLAYPDGGPQPLAYVEPINFPRSTFPLVHIRDKSLDDRLFGANGKLATLLPHELGHAFHFSALPFATRVMIEVAYIEFLISHITEPYHGTDLETTPFVAFVEAVGLFSERFYFYSKLVASNLTGDALRAAFVQDELTTQSLAGRPDYPDYTSVGRLDTIGFLSAGALKNRSIEGSVYGAIYLHLSRLLNLRGAMALVIRSRATTVTELAKYVKGLGARTPQSTQRKSAMRTVVRTWFR